MAGRSLIATPNGLTRAKQTLEKRQLSQRSLTTELGYAWATINKFFTGKPVDRFYFVEICNHLNLDWETLITDSAPAPPPSEITPLLQALQTQATAARQALTPRILDRIPRQVVRQKYLPAIDRGLTGEQQRIIPIIGPAGYGKSTILGDLYDELLQAHTPWVGLILCSSIAIDAQASQIDANFGQSLCGEAITIVKAIEQLNANYGRGVLLIDTIDLLINRDFTSTFATLLRQLLQHGATIVFTCRDHDYNDHLEPTRERLPGLGHTLDRHTVPNFSTAEIRTAATQFFQKLAPDIPDHGQQFADRLLQLSADNRSLLEILQNPLLLALLCDLFAQDQNIPADLTVSKLYNRYWQEKIAYSRPDQSRYVPLAIAKENLCLTIAKVLFDLSHDRLYESIFRDDLSIDFTEIIINAYNDLLSEGVIEHLPSTKLHFFHQTLLEYAIAYWLTRQQATTARTTWLQTLTHPDSSRYQNYWYPILRQYLTLIDSETEFTQLATTIGPSNLAAFGAIAYAAVSRDRPDALQQLLPTALSLGEAYQKRLQQAIEAAPKRIILATWPLLLDLLTQSRHAIAINTAKMISLLIARWWQELRSHIPEAMDGIAIRSPTHHDGKDDRALLMGWLLQQWLPRLTEQPDPAILTTLRQHYCLLGHRTSIVVIQIHQHPEVPVAAQIDLFELLLRQEIPNDKHLAETILDFVAQLLNHPAAGIPTPLDFLDQSHPKRWDNIQARAVGRVSTQQPAQLQTLLHIILENPESVGKRFSLAYTAILEAINSGAINPIVDFFCNLDLSTVNAPAKIAILRFLNRIVPQLSVAHQDAIATWLTITDDVNLTLHLIDTLADDSLVARSYLKTNLPNLPASEQKIYQAKYLRFLPITEQPALSALDKETQLALIRSYHRQMSIESTDRLLQASHSRLRDIALQASLDWPTARIAQLKPHQILPLLPSQFPGIQERALIWLQHHTDRITATELNTICSNLKNPDNAAIARIWCELIATWIKANRQVPDRVLPTLDKILNSLIQQGRLDGAPAKPMIQVLKAIGQSEDNSIDLSRFYDCISQLIMSINLISIPHSEPETVDVLCALVRISPTSLVKLIDAICPVLVDKRLWRNLSAIIYTITRTEGRTSPHFATIAQSHWYHPEVEAIVLESRGL
jgi:DNA-binding Xre family transcriptional regulator